MKKEKFNILFLDFDDVLNSIRSVYKKFAEALGVEWTEEDFDPKYWGQGNIDEINPELQKKIQDALDEKKKDKSWEFPNLSGENYPHDEFAIQNLNKIIEENDAKVVICSSWRLGRSVKELQDILNSWGAKCEVIGVTPKKMSSTRGEEIWMWIRDNSSKIKGFCILDDSLFDISPWLDEYCVHGIKGHHHGLRDIHIPEAKKCFDIPFNAKKFKR
jgi:hypothetical protein